MNPTGEKILIIFPTRRIHIFSEDEVVEEDEVDEDGGGRWEEEEQEEEGPFQEDHVCSIPCNKKNNVSWGGG